MAKCETNFTNYEEKYIIVQHNITWLTVLKYSSKKVINLKTLKTIFLNFSILTKQIYGLIIIMYIHMQWKKVTM